MIKKTLYFGNPAYLSLKNNQLQIRLPNNITKDSNATEQENLITKPIEDIGVMVLDNQQITITHGLMSALLDNNIAVITCNNHGMPTGILLTLSGNSVQSERFNDQLKASIPLKKQLWQQTIQTKIGNQAKVLERCVKCETKLMKAWQSKVRSGDVENVEARAAAYYWKRLFCDIEYFSRDRYGMPPNNILNYGYAILRGVVARALVASGLLPTIGIHHHNRYNAYCLADDIMEPYRPYVDELVYRTIEAKGTPPFELNREWKSTMLVVPTLDVTIGGLRRPLMVAVSQTTASLYKCFTGELRRIAYPEM